MKNVATARSFRDAQHAVLRATAWAPR